MIIFDLFVDLTIKITIIIIIGLLSYYARFLDFKGVIAGIIIGLPVIVFGGYSWFLILFSFLLVGSVASHISSKCGKYSNCNSEKYLRSWKNVIANGIWPMLAALLLPFTQCSDHIWLNYNILLIFYVSSITTMLSDTIATETGLLSPEEPRLIHKPCIKVTKGVSGGVTIAGTLFSFITSVVYAVFSYLILHSTTHNSLTIKSIVFIPTVSLASFTGCLLDSLIGGILQPKYRCIDDEKIVENVLECKNGAILISGCKFIDNHIVNFIASLLGGLISIVIYILLQNI